ncbi:MAG TPA: toll/interleukin-1 receptor domain-containing protein, partial [Thermoanaerobaculia bacterium]
MPDEKVAFDVFLSHNSRDKPAVREIADVLERLGLHAWLDERELPPGALWQDEIENII